MMKKYILTALFAGLLSAAGCSDSGSQKKVEETGLKSAETNPDMAVKGSASAEAELTAEVEKLAKGRQEAQEKYNAAVTAYEKVRSDLLDKRAKLKAAQDGGQSLAANELTESLKPLLQLEAGAVAAHKEFVSVSDEFAKKSADLTALRKKM
jgi:hypothetical protein